MAVAVAAIAGGLALPAIETAEAQRPPVAEHTIFAVTSTNRIVIFTSDRPDFIRQTYRLPFLGSGETVAAIDFRPANGLLYGVTGGGRAFVLNPATGVSSVLGCGQASVTGTRIDIDFNPVPDLIRYVTNGGQNRRLTPAGCLVGNDGTLRYAAGDVNQNATPNIVGAAYTNSTVGAGGTNLYVIDATLDILARQGSAFGNPVGPNSGQLFTIGTLGVDTTDDAGFDIAFQGDAFVTLTRPNARTSTLYTIELASGYTRPIGRVGDPDFNQTVRAIAVIAAIDYNDFIRSLLSTP